MPHVMTVVSAVAAIAGLTLIVLAVRGRSTLHHPRCARCRHDLRTFGARPRTCPECGADLAEPSAVVFGERRRSPALAAIGVALLLLSASLPMLVRAFAGTAPAVPAGPNTAALRRPAHLDDDELLAFLRDPATGRSPDGWTELGVRLEASRLTTEQRAIAAATMSDLVRASPGERGADPRGWSSAALVHLLSRDDLDDAQIVELADAWTGTPRLVPLGRVAPETAAPLRLAPRSRTPGADVIRRAARIRAVRVDGKPVDPVPRDTGVGGRGGRGGGVALPPMAPGDYTVEVDVEWVLVTGSPVASGRGRDWPFGDNAELPEPHGAPARRLARGTVTLTDSLTVVAAGEHIQLSAVDPSKRQAVAEGIRMKHATIRPSSTPGKEELDILLDADPPPGVSLLMRVVAVIGDQRHAGETFSVIVDGPMVQFRGAPILEATIDALPPDMLMIEVLLEPVLDDRSQSDPRLATVWGEPIPLGPVRLTRLER